MKYLKKHVLVLLLVSFFGILKLEAQNDKKKPFVLNLSEDGKQYIKFGMNTQIWARYTELNPNSAIGTNIVDHSEDIVIRRLRLQALGMLTENIFFHVQIGQNNINFASNAPSAQLAILDLLGEYHFNDKLHIGGGLTGWGAGTTRYSAQSSSCQLTLDTPIYQQNINISSTFGNRNLSVYAKGLIKKLSYRFAITNPYVNNSVVGVNSSVSSNTPRAQYSAMTTYHFLETESTAEPFNKGTYLGTKKVFNLGIGYMIQSKAMWHKSLIDPTVTEFDDMKVFGADALYEAPLSSKGNALTLYGAFNNCNYGKNYIRTIATPNPAKPNANYSNSGNGFIGVGTGNIYYSQVGYLFGKSSNEKKTGRFQMFASTEIAALEALDEPMTMYELGLNYYFKNNLGPKVTLGYQNRSISENLDVITNKLTQTDRKGMVVLQMQVNF
jgi:hypothetical protein